MHISRRDILQKILKKYMIRFREYFPIAAKEPRIECTIIQPDIKNLQSEIYSKTDSFENDEMSIVVLC